MDDRGILDEPSITLLSNSYRSITATNSNSEQVPTVAMAQSNSQQLHKKKQCSSPLSTCDDKTSGCSTPSLSPIKNESLVNTDQVPQENISTPLFLALPAICSRSPVSVALSSGPGSRSSSALDSSKRNKLKMSKNSDDTSLDSFERHELSAAEATLLSSNEKKSFKQIREQSSPLERPHSVSTVASNADWSYFITVANNQQQANEKPEAISNCSSSSSTSTSTSLSVGHEDQFDLSAKKNLGGVEFFVGTRSNYNSAGMICSFS